MATGSDKNGNDLLPVFFKLEELDTLVVGGGKMGFEKVRALLSNSGRARITVLAPDILDEIVALTALHRNLKLYYRVYDSRMLDDIDLLVIAVNDPALSVEIASDAKERGILTNVPDSPGLCDFYLGSVVRKGNLKIAISTNGRSPTMAKRLREYLEEQIPEEIDDLLTDLNEIRHHIKGDLEEKIKVLDALTKGLLHENGKINAH